MLNELKNKSLKRFLGTAIVLFIIGAAILFFARGRIAGILKGTVDFYEVEDGTKLLNRYVDIEVSFCFGSFAEYYEENETTKIKTTKFVYYVIPTADYQYMAIRVPYAQRGKMSSITDQTNALFDGENVANVETLEYTGFVRKMNKDEREAFLECFSEDTTDMLTYCLYVDADNKTMYGVIGIVGLLFLLYPVVGYALILSGSKQRSMLRYMKKNGIDIGGVEYDYANGAKIGKDVRVGRYYVIYQHGAKSKIIRISDIIWTHFHVVNTTHNGVTTTTYSVKAYLRDRSIIAIPIKNEELAKEVVANIGSTSQKIILGYNEEHYKMFKKNFDEFLRLAESMELRREEPGVDEDVARDDGVSDDTYDVFDDKDKDTFGDKDKDPFGDRDKDPFGDKDKDFFGDKDKDPFGDKDKDFFGDKDKDFFGDTVADDDPFADILKKK